jgi:hypothetical protein
MEQPTTTKITTLLSVSLVVEEEADMHPGIGWPANEEIRKAVLSAVAVLLRDHPHVRVEWASTRSTPLDDKPWFGRCAVCDRWVYDYDTPSELGADGVTRGAKINGRFRCDEHLPHGHPLCFAGRGYDGPVPEA